MITQSALSGNEERDVHGTNRIYDFREKKKRKKKSEGREEKGMTGTGK